LDANDTAGLTAELSNGAIGTIQTTRWAGGELNALRLNLYGTKGSLKVRLCTNEPPLQISEGEAFDKGEWVDLESLPVPTIHERLVRWIRTGERQTPDFARGAEIQAVMDACFVSAEAGREMVVDSLGVV